MAYYSLEPWGEERADYRSGVVCATIVNSNPYRKKGSPAAKPEDFVPDYDREPRKRQTPADMELAARCITLAMGGEIRDGEHR